MSETPSNTAFAKMRKELAEAKVQAAELEARKAQEQRVRTAYFMAREAQFPENYTRLMVTAARERDDYDLREMFNDITEILDEGTTA